MAGRERNAFPWLRSRRSKVIFCVGGLLFSVLFILWNVELSPGSLWPDETELENMRRELKTAQAQRRELAGQLEEMKRISSRYHAAVEAYWQNARQGDPELEVRSLLENTAREAGFKFASIGSVRKSRVNAEIYAIEVDLNGRVQLGQLTDFLARMDAFSPPVYWKRIDLRLDPRGGDGLLNFNAVLRIPACEEGKK